MTDRKICLDWQPCDCPTVAHYPDVLHKACRPCPYSGYTGCVSIVCPVNGADKHHEEWTDTNLEVAS